METILLSTQYDGMAIYTCHDKTDGAWMMDIACANMMPNKSCSICLTSAVGNS